MDDATAERLYRHLYASLDHDNAGDLETFGRNFLQNGAMWDRLADLFPTIKASELRGVMMRAFEQWQRDHAQCDHPSHHHHLH
ncbi:MAG: hypothetical protein NVV74_22280 [Magnetospirillum sp.]|nr:hypothetical protein [Magnetospirillum sp.]